MSVGLMETPVGDGDWGHGIDWAMWHQQMAGLDMPAEDTHELGRPIGVSPNGMRYLLGEGQDDVLGREIGRQRLENLSELGMVGVRGEQILPPMSKAALIQLGRTGVIRRGQ